ncbi:MAG: DUF1573 domain-containing protein [Bacteroidota bacterium]
MVQFKSSEFTIIQSICFYLQFVIITILFSVTVFSCNQKTEQKNDGGISTEIVNNPISASGTEKNKAKPEIKFENEIYDFGKIIQGEKVTYSYMFNNTGDADLIISAVSASCGCAVPTWPKNPIAPGSEGYINIIFNSAGKKGWQSKDITVVTNAIPNTRVLNIIGEVMIPEANDGK